MIFHRLPMTSSIGNVKNSALIDWCRNVSTYMYILYNTIHAVDLGFLKIWSKTTFHVGSINGIFTYIYHKNPTKCRQIYHTWMVWAREASRFSDALPGSYVEVLGWFAGKKLSHHQLAFRLNDKKNLRCGAALGC